jgi:hypothetical protein
MHALAIAMALSLGAEPTTLVAVAPGYPGSTAEAQPAMDALAAALAAAAGLPAGSVAATYHEAAEAGLERLRKPDAALAMVTLPFYLQHAAALSLEARLTAVPKGSRPAEVWSLVARKGRVASPASLDGWRIVSIAGYAPAFVAGTALGGWGRLPAGAQVVQSGQVLSAMRKAVAGEDVAVLLDGAQAAALPTLPFAGDLEVVARSEPLPSSVVATVGKRLSPERWSALEKAFLGLAASPGGPAALEGVRMGGFVPVDRKGLEAARKAYAAVAR